MIIDTHCHLFKEYYKDDLDEVIQKMNGNIMINSGVGIKSNKEVISLCNKYKNMYGAIGYHPEEADTYTEEGLKYIEDNLNSNRIVAIGEIGLDYHYGKENRDKQIEIFIKQLRLARKYNMPVIVHSREATEDTYRILKEELYDTKCVLHCYNSSLEMAKEYIKLGVKLGVGGVITFKNNKTLKEVVKNIDLSHIMLETDSPYLTPEPNRGKRNEPYYVYNVASQISEIKEIPVEKVIEITTKNALLQFDLNI